MLRENCRVGMKVVCGRPNGEKTVGEVVEVHEKKAEVRTLESRGDGNRGSEEHRTKKQPAGTVWGFTFDLMEPLAPALLEALRSLPPKEERLLEYLERGSESLIIEKVIKRRAGAYMENDEETAILQAISINYKNRRSLAQSIAAFRRKMSAAADKPGACGRCEKCRSLREEREVARLEIESLNMFLDDQNRRLAFLFQAIGRPLSEAVSCAYQDDLRIGQEIKKEFPDIWDRMKANRHWRKIRDEIFPHDHDHKKRILVWNERRLSEAWIKAGLNEPSTATHRFPAPRPLDWVKSADRQSSPTVPNSLPTLEESRRAWKEQIEAERNQKATHTNAQTP